MKRKRKQYSGAFKAKVGLKALTWSQDNRAVCARVSSASAGGDAMESGHSGSVAAEHPTTMRGAGHESNGLLLIEAIYPRRSLSVSGTMAWQGKQNVRRIRPRSGLGSSSKPKL